MSVTNKTNIIWIVTDSARNFSTGGLDDRDKPSYYDELRNDFVYFENAVTSAPSSVMSAGTMLTGLNSYFVARNYDDFRYEKGIFPNLADMLKEDGYYNTSIFVAREMRDKVAPFIGIVDRKYWPKELKHSDYMWENKSANIVLENFLNDYSFSQPLFLMLWNNIRHDYQISERLKEIIDILKEHNLYDNSLIIMNADHGYPHPRRGFTPEGLERKGLTHDLMLSDDNILIPLLIRAPGAIPRSVNEQVGTVDLFPTVFDYANLSHNFDMYLKPDGLGLRGVIEGGDCKNLKERLIRCDCRFVGQAGRKTAIRSNEYKYVYDHDSSSEEFFDLIKDPGEDSNAIEDNTYSKIIEKFRKKYLEEERLSSDFQSHYVSMKLINKLKKYNSVDEFIFISLFEENLNDIVKSVLDAELSGFSYKFFGKEIIENEVSCESSGITTSGYLKTIREINTKNTLVICLVVSRDSEQSQKLAHNLKKAGIRKFLTLDINFYDKVQIKWTTTRLIKALWSRKNQIVEEPKLLLTYGKQFFCVVGRALK